MNKIASSATAILAIITVAVILAFAAVMTVSAQSNDPDWRQAPTGLSVTTGNEAGKLDINWDTSSQDTKTLSDYRVTWKPDGEAFKNWGETDWNAFPSTNELTLTGLNAGATYQVKVRARYDDNKRSKWSAVVTAQSGVTSNAAATGQPIISGTAQVRQTLTAGTSSIADDNGLTNVVFSHQWIRVSDGADTDIAHATTETYVLGSADLEHSIKVQVRFTDDDGYQETLTSDATMVVMTPPNIAARGVPDISGVAEEGETLTAGTSSIADDNGLANAVFTHQWIRSVNGTDMDIPGATASTHLLSADDLEHSIKVQVRFTDDNGYHETLTSDATMVVTGEPNIVATGVPAISGLAEVRQTLTVGTSSIADDNGLTNAVFTHQWIRVSDGADTDIAHATTETYVLGSADLEHSIKVQVRFTDDDGYQETLTSDATMVVMTPPNIAARGVPDISGVAEEGETLTAGTSSIADDNGLANAVFTHQWIRSVNGTDMDIPGATASTHLLNADDLAHSIKVRVNFTDDDGYTETVTSKDTDAVVAPTNVAPSGLPAITGTAEQGETLNADTSGIADDNGLMNVVFSHQWIRSTDGADTDIADATTSTYTVTSADAGSAIRVRVSFTDDDGYAETLTSKTTGQVTETREDEQTLHSSHSIATEVPHNWGLTPPGLNAGAKFRLIFLSSTKRNATSAAIADYNTFVQGHAAAGHDDIQYYSSGFRVVGCTAAVDARDNTRTTGNGVPIYWLNGNKVADHYADFYDGNWDDEANDRNEAGNNGPDTSNTNNYPFTGCDHDGTESIVLDTSYALGTSVVRVGRPNSSNSGHGPLSSGGTATNSGNRPMYGLSQVFEVPPPPEVDLATRLQAQSLTTFVSNTDLSVNHFTSSFLAQSFKTGTNAGGYTVSEVDIRVYSGSVNNIAVKIRKGRSGAPGDLVAPLMNPASLRFNSLNTFKAPDGTTLAANTTYWLTVGEGITSRKAEVSAAEGNDETGEPGWTISNGYRFRIEETDSWSTTTFSLLITIKGTISTDATLSGLVLEGADGGETITLSPAFAANTETYTAAVVNRIDAVKLTATKKDDNATVVITNDDDPATRDEAKLDLNVGSNTLTVTVTAQNGDTLTYTVSVERHTADTLVSNTHLGWTGSDTALLAQSFRTGANEADYTVSEVDIALVDTSGKSTAVKIRENNDDNEPGDLVAALMNPGTLTANSLNTFTAPAGTKLAANTTYWLTMNEGISSNRVQVAATEGNDETGEPGLTIGDGRLWRTDETDSWSTETFSLLTTIKGTTLSTDVTLSDLVLEGADSGETITLSPAFAANQYTYRAGTVNSVDEITIAPTVNHSNAEYQIGDVGGNALTDADLNETGFQFALSEGTNTLTVTVTSQDVNATLTYTVTVERHTADTLVSNTHLGSTGFDATVLAQSFRTGANEAGYTVSEVDIYLGPTSSKSTSVRIRESNPNDRPGILVATLTNPTSLTSDSLNTFTAPAVITLAANTTYWLTVNEGISSTNRAQARTILGHDEAGEPGLTIGDGRLRRTDETFSWATRPSSLVIAIKGIVVPTITWVSNTHLSITVATLTFQAQSFETGTNEAAGYTVSYVHISLGDVSGGSTQCKDQGEQRQQRTGRSGGRSHEPDVLDGQQPQHLHGTGRYHAGCEHDLLANRERGNLHGQQADRS